MITGYNLQASSNNQFIVNYTLAQTTADTTTLINHLEEYQESFNNSQIQLPQMQLTEVNKTMPI